MDGRGHDRLHPDYTKRKSTFPGRFGKDKVAHEAPEERAYRHDEGGVDKSLRQFLKRTDVRQTPWERSLPPGDTAGTSLQDHQVVLSQTKKGIPARWNRSVVKDDLIKLKIHRIHL